MSGPNPHLAEAMVTHAEAICRHEDHLWDVIHDLQIPSDSLIDTRQQHKVSFETEPLARAFLYRFIRGLSENKLANHLQTRPTLVKAFQFDVTALDEAPTQATLNYAWQQFGDDTQMILETAATGIREVAVDHDVVSEALVPTDPADDDDDEETDSKEANRQKTQKTIKLASKHAFPEFESGRCINRSYDDADILEMIARVCAYRGSAHSEGEYGWLTDDDLTASGSTILRVLKQFATPDDADSQLTLDEFGNADAMPVIEAIRDTVSESFDSALENIIASIKGAGPFSDRRKTAAIDITYEQVTISPWIDKDQGITRDDYPSMVSGYKKDNAIKRGYKYATITLAGELAPIILGVEPVKESSVWEDDDAASYAKAEIVERLLAKAEQVVDLDEVFLDRGFYSTDVYAAIDDRDILYTAPVPRYEDDYDAIANIKEHPTADAAVKHDVIVADDSAVNHTAEMLYVPSQSDDADGSYAVFMTNRDRVEPEEIDAVCGRYRRRWDIENQYKSLGEFYPKSSSMDYRVRYTKFVVAALIYNLWRLTDYLIKVARDIEIRSAPEVTAKTFVRVLGDFLREID